MEILYRGKPFIYEDMGDYHRLTSLEKVNGRATVLEFTKDAKKSEAAIESFSTQIRKTIIRNHLTGANI
ncbi:hypothetical protein [Bacillus atrophaeus]|uniref:Uncharacterized protein n=1 Tax=Bacillus atrophaeus (strain 1942) TaxID=720555 RepID=A0ABN3ZCK2_BACA1|nr:hypothetical protein [Bacillus atrophaeus]AMR62359.1 hypothetical protein A1D11_08035 [Bacillus subtilis subsp. globigii]ADP32849.1 hypothetical protein BATR1942_09580 [Bacillus atrophaeus 1942]AIK48345.1 hypothetical protein DJ95_1799 [Bacillus atrophaeus subsp. globigii]ASS71654.1 hypothetical protein BaGK_12155 [Bacillus atrophaeus]EIM12030.1 hypothetical protein UY9_03773 [Bacillus atrophaeus C89]